MEKEERMAYFQERWKGDPALLTENRFSDNREFHSWQTGNPYFGRQFSIFGDSISTLDGYNPEGYNVFYSDDNCVKSGVIAAKDTWWDQVIRFFGGKLLVNNSWSGSRVTKLRGRVELFPSGCSDERTAALHINSVMPDVILVYLGTNDWAFGVDIGNETVILGQDINEHFCKAYDGMLKKLKANYPKSEIWCCTICETYMSKRPDFKFPHRYGGIHIEQYNEVIRDAARCNHCRLIDLYDYHMAYDSVDGSHPTNAGMNTIATMVIRSIIGSEADQFLDCKEGQHAFRVVEEYTGGARYVCSRCGKTIHTKTLLPADCPEDQHEYVMYDRNENGEHYRCKKCGKQKSVCSWTNLMADTEDETEYVMLGPDRTSVFYSNILRLAVESTGMTVQFQKDVVEVGRDMTCDLFVKDKTYVARRHATFFYKDNSWFLRDNFSTNGTWINGVKIQPGKKYQLAANDEINFAMSEKVIFYKYEYNPQSAGNPAAKAVAFLWAGMETFAKSDGKDAAALKLIIAALSEAPLYFPAEIDLEAMFGSVDPTKLKPGDTLQPDKDVKMRILTLTLENGMEFVPMFTSNEEVNKGPSVSIIRLYPQDYLPKLIQMDKPVIINPFSENRFLLSKQLMTDVLLPIVQNKTAPYSNMEQQSSEEKYIGRIIAGKYRVLELIGRGGYSTTYLVRNMHSNKVWAMKVCDKKTRNYSPAIRENILTELYMMKKLNHPAIPKVVDIIEDEEGIYIVRDYIEGKTLEAIVKMYGAQPAKTVMEWGKQLCDVLRYLHSQTPPHIYRDMKPANVILKPDGFITIIDFGIMRTYKPNQNNDTCYIGTKGYAAPEQFGGSQTDARTDIYGLGMTMYQLVTGINPTEPPYEIKPICCVNPNLPKNLECIILKCIQPNPDKRYQTCGELFADLNHCLSLPKNKGIFSKLFGGR